MSKAGHTQLPHITALPKEPRQNNTVFRTQKSQQSALINKFQAINSLNININYLPKQKPQ
jgi:hypothetical protein